MQAQGHPKNLIPESTRKAVYLVFLVLKQQPPQVRPVDQGDQVDEGDQVDGGAYRVRGISMASSSAQTSQPTETRIVRGWMRRKRLRSRHPRSVTVR